MLVEQMKPIKLAVYWLIVQRQGLSSSDKECVGSI